MDDFLKININIAQRTYPMKIRRSEEEKIRKAAKVIDERILQYQSRYKDKDHQDFLAMSALQFVIQLLETMDKNDVNPFIEQVREINDQLTEYLTT